MLLLQKIILCGQSVPVLVLMFLCGYAKFYFLNDFFFLISNRIYISCIRECVHKCNIL